MRKGQLLIAAVGAVLLAACSSEKKDAMNDDLKRDLELAFSSEGINLAGANTAGAQVVSAIERTDLPARKAAPSRRVRRHKPAPKSPPQRVVAEAEADVSEEEMTPVDEAPVAVDPAPVSPRPQPVLVSYPGGYEGSMGRGPSRGEIVGVILGSVIRGSSGDIDHCDPRTDGRRRNGGTMINIGRRMPETISGFPPNRLPRSAGASFPTNRFPRSAGASFPTSRNTRSGGSAFPAGRFPGRIAQGR